MVSSYEVRTKLVDESMLEGWLEGQYARGWQLAGLAPVLDTNGYSTRSYVVIMERGPL